MTARVSWSALEAVLGGTPTRPGVLGGQVPGRLAELEGAHVLAVRRHGPVVAARLGLDDALEEGG